MALPPALRLCSSRAILWLAVVPVAAMSGCASSHGASADCYSDANCQAGEACVSGACQVREPCVTDSDCSSPGPCEIQAGAYCDGRGCRYEAYACVQASPINPCRSPYGECKTAPSGSSCIGQSCCVFESTWPTGSASSAPACALAGKTRTITTPRMRTSHGPGAAPTMEGVEAA
jgi:hypothetical protein